METQRISYRVIRSSRRTAAIQIVDGEVLVRCSRRMGETAVQAFVESKADWIQKHLAQQAAAPKLPPLTGEEIRRLAREAMEDLPARVVFFAPLVDVTYGRITIRNQRSRWGSCSSQGNLNLNCLLMLTPPEVRDYVVVHELCHRKEMNHSAAFWAEVGRILPDYQERQRWLRENGPALIRRLNG